MASSTTNPNRVAGQEIEGSDVEIPADGVQLKAYLARPKGGGANPAVIVIHENKGLVPYIRDVVDGLASSSYIAVAPDLLSRDGGTESIADMSTVLPQIPRERHMGDLQAVVRYLKSRPDVTQIGIIGFCFGGGVTWQFATANQDLAAAVPFYGSNPPLEAVPNIRAAVFAVYGELDERVNQGIPAISQALKDAGITHDSKVYPKAPHAFHNHTNADRYIADAATSAWADALTWLDRHLRG